MDITIYYRPSVDMDLDKALEEEAKKYGAERTGSGFFFPEATRDIGFDGFKTTDDVDSFREAAHDLVEEAGAEWVDPPSC